LARPGCFPQTFGRGREGTPGRQNGRNNFADLGSAVNHPAFPDFGNLWHDWRQHRLLSQAQMEMYGVADVF